LRLLRSERLRSGIDDRSQEKHNHNNEQ
jgi:hypothetical protein